MDSLPAVLLLLLTVIFVITQFVMLILVHKSIQSHKKDHLGDERMWGEARSKSNTIVSKALTKANDIISEAEKKGVDILTKEEDLAKNLADEYKKHLEAVEEAFRSQFEHTTASADQALEAFITQVGHVVNDEMTKNEKLIEHKSDAMLQEAKEELEKMRADTKARVNEEIKRELDTSQAEITEYKMRRLKMIDERIIQMLEDVVKVALEKKLSLAEQSELVYRALDEAKRENAFL